MKLLLLAFLAVAAAAPVRGAAGPDAAIVRRVADAVLAGTTRRLIDTQTGATFEESTNLPVRTSVRIDSKFNTWFYQTWLLTDGMRRTAAALDEPRYRDYGEQNLAFIYRHMDYFEKQRAAGLRMQPVGDGQHSPIGFYFHMDSLWHTGLAPLVHERHTATRDSRYEPFLQRMRNLLANHPRFDDGAFYRRERGLMTDDPYMVVPFLLREWKATGDARHLDDAVRQVLGTHERLLDPTHGLLWHLWDLKTRAPAGQFWGRGNGWMVLAQVDLLEALPNNHPRRAEVLAAFRRHLDGIRHHQDPAGGWHQVIDHPESWIETSGTGMFVYGLARGVNEGWLDASFADAARKGWAALKTKVTPEGDLVDVCGSTGTGTLEFYLNRPRLQGDLHGFGSFLLAGSEMIRMERAAK
jgi:rhamnogalacturonyl hydrolase YesR